MPKLPTTPRAITEPKGPSRPTVAELAETVRSLRTELFEVRRRLEQLNQNLHDHELQQDRELLTDRIVVTGKQGVIVLGDINGESTGVQVVGRAECTRLSVAMAVDNGSHSMPVSPKAEVIVGGDSGHVHLSAPALPMEAPALWIEADKGRYSGGVRLGHRHQGYGEGLDVQGGWIGVLELTDGEAGGHRAVIDANLLDDVASATWKSVEGAAIREWERT